MRIFKDVSCCLAFIILNCIFQPAYAVKPPLVERAFHEQWQKVGGGSTFANPWVDIRPIKIPPENKDAIELQDWLLQRQANLETWPPRYRDDKEAIALIKAWQDMRPQVEKWQTSLQESPELAALAATFWVYGHNLDEEDASVRAFELIEELNVKFSSHPLPLMMKGMLRSSTGGKESHSMLKQAKAKTKDKSLLGLIDLTIANQCSYSFMPHQSFYALSEAIDACPECVRRYKELALVLAGKSGSDPKAKLENPYFLNQEKEQQMAGSRFFGFKAKLPAGWSVDGYSPYEPQKPIGAFMFNAAPLPDSGLVHGLMFFTALNADGGSVQPAAAFLSLFGRPENGVQVSSIKPLVKNSYLTDWYRLDTQNSVGKNDTITMIAASGILRSETWKIADHRKLAKEEGSCERPDIKPGELHFLRLNARVKAPVEFTVNYSASKGSYAEAEKKMKEVIAALEFNAFALSEVEAKLLQALK